MQVLSDLNQAAGELGLGPRPLSVETNKEEGELEISVKDGLAGETEVPAPSEATRVFEAS